MNVSKIQLIWSEVSTLPWAYSPTEECQCSKYHHRAFFTYDHGNVYQCLPNVYQCSPKYHLRAFFTYYHGNVYQSSKDWKSLWWWWLRWALAISLQTIHGNEYDDKFSWLVDIFWLPKYCRILCKIIEWCRWGGGGDWLLWWSGGWYIVAAQVNRLNKPSEELGGKGVEQKGSCDKRIERGRIKSSLERSPHSPQPISMFNELKRN